MAWHETTMNFFGMVPKVGSGAENWPDAIPYWQTTQSLTPIIETSESGGIDNDKIAEGVVRTAIELNALSNAQVKAQADAGDVKAAYDYGLRVLVGWKCRKSPITARPYFAKILNSTANTRLIAQAHLCMALTYLDVEAWRSCKIVPKERDAFNASYHYNEAAKLGYGKCPALLYFVQGVAMQRQQLLSLQLWTDMWAIHDERNEEIEAERRQAAEKFAKRPNRYVCAQEGCGITANTGKILQRCGGKCNEEYKPYYCTKDCQRKDWKRHKPFCAPSKPPPVSMPPIPTSMPSERGGQPVRSITIPHPCGEGTMQISTSSVDPEILRAIRDLALGRSE